MVTGTGRDFTQNEPPPEVSFRVTQHAQGWTNRHGQRTVPEQGQEQLAAQLDPMHFLDFLGAILAMLRPSDSPRASRAT